MSLKQKTISGLTWTFIDKISNQGLQFIIGIILARLLSPNEYGLTGMVAIFLALSNVFISSGFADALVRKKDPSSEDYSTVFIYNVFIAILCYLLLLIFAGSLSRFFNEPVLKNIIIILCVTIIINSIGFIPRAFLWKKMDFKRLTIISLISTIISGVAGIILAYLGYGVWSLVWKSIVASIVTTFMLFILSSVKIRIKFSLSSFKELFGFSSKIMVSELLNQIYLNIYSLVIAKFYNARELGLYTRADNYKNLPSRTLNNFIQTVSYPVLAEIKDDKTKLKAAYKRLIKSTMMITFFLMLIMAATADNLILGLIGQKWKDAIPYLQLLCFVGMFYPLHALNINMLNVQGKSGTFLLIETIKKILAVPTILIGIFWGIMPMIYSVLILNLVGYYLNSYWSGKLVNYPILDQVSDILPSFLLSFIIAVLVYSTGRIIHLPPLQLLIIQIIIGFISFILLCEFIRMKDYLYLKEIIKEQFVKIKTNGSKREETNICDSTGSSTAE